MTDLQTGVNNALNNALENDPTIASATARELALEMQQWDADLENVELSLLETAAAEWLRTSATV